MRCGLDVSTTKLVEEINNILNHVGWCNYRTQTLNELNILFLIHSIYFIRLHIPPIVAVNKTDIARIAMRKELFKEWSRSSKKFKDSLYYMAFQVGNIPCPNRKHYVDIRNNLQFTSCHKLFRLFIYSTWRSVNMKFTHNHNAGRHGY